MRALTHDTFGDPEHVLTVTERPTPEPGPGQVRLKIVLSPIHNHDLWTCLLYTSPSPRDRQKSRMPSSA